MLVSSVPAPHYSAPHPMAQQPPVGQGLLIIEASRTHSDTPHSVGLFWTRDRPDPETSTWQHASLRWGRHPCPREDSNPQSQQVSGRKPTQLTVRPLVSDRLFRWDIFLFGESLWNRDFSSRRCWWYSTEWSGKMAETYFGGQAKRLRDVSAKILGFFLPGCSEAAP